MIKFNLLKESKGTKSWEMYQGGYSPDYFQGLHTQYNHGLNVISTSPRMDYRLGRDINMKIVYGNAQCGKTIYLIHESITYNYTIVCHNTGEKHRLIREAELIYNRIRLPPPITYHDYIGRNYYGIRTNGFLIDNIDLFLESFRASAPIKGFTIRTYDN